MRKWGVTATILPSGKSKKQGGKKNEDRAERTTKFQPALHAIMGVKNKKRETYSTGAEAY